MLLRLLARGPLSLTHKLSFREKLEVQADKQSQAQGTSRMFCIYIYLAEHVYYSNDIGSKSPVRQKYLPCVAKTSYAYHIVARVESRASLHLRSTLLRPPQLRRSTAILYHV